VGKAELNRPTKHLDRPETLGCGWFVWKLGASSLHGRDRRSRRSSRCFCDSGRLVETPCRIGRGASTRAMRPVWELDLAVEPLEELTDRLP
jgi:hypothetical protein